MPCRTTTPRRTTPWSDWSRDSQPGAATRPPRICCPLSARPGPSDRGRSEESGQCPEHAVSAATVHSGVTIALRWGETVREEIEFDAEGVTLRGYFYPPAGVAETAPVVVMAHGWG